MPETAERNFQDVELNVATVVNMVVDHVKHTWESVNECRLRFFGGWVLADGRRTQQGHWVAEALRAARGLRNGIRVLPEMAFALCTNPSAELRGTARIRRERRSYTLQQKMVDTMITADLLTLPLMLGERIVLYSDDDDVVPGLIACRPGREVCDLVRKRASETRPNDPHLLALGVTVHTY